MDRSKKIISTNVFKNMLVSICQFLHLQKMRAKNTGKFLLMCRHMNQLQKETYIMKDFTPAYIN